MMQAKLIGGILLFSIFATSTGLAADSINYDFDDVNVLYAATFIAHPINGVSHSNTWVSELVDVRSDEPECGLWRGSFFTSDGCLAPFDEQGARKYIYQCYDGTEGKLGDDSSCKSKKDWENMADADCKTRCPQIPSKKLVVTYGIIELKKEGHVLVTEEFIKVGQGENAKRFLVNSGSIEYYGGTEKPSNLWSLYWSAKKLEGTSVIKDKTPPIYVTCMSRKLNQDGTVKSFLLSFRDYASDPYPDVANCEEMMFEADADTIHDSGNQLARPTWMG